MSLKQEILNLRYSRESLEESSLPLKLLSSNNSREEEPNTLKKELIDFSSYLGEQNNTINNMSRFTFSGPD